MTAVRLLSWNIHGAVGMDRRCDPERIVRVIAEADPDILVLQEVDGRSHLGRRREAFEFFAAALGSHVVEARMFGRPGREHGNLLWSRWPLRTETVHALPGGIEPRGLIAVEAETPIGSLHVLGSHFSLSIPARRRQADAIRTIANALSGPVVLCGDFNEWRTSGPVHRRLSAALPVHHRPPSWPTWRPLVRMDRVYASRGVAVRALSHPEAAGAASDHLPVYVELTLEP